MPGEPLLPAEIQPGLAHHGRTSMSSIRSSIRSLSPSPSEQRSGMNGKKAPGGIMSKLGLGGVARRTLGITLLMFTVFLWTASNFLASSIFSGDAYDKPFFVVYINTSIFAISLIPMSIQFMLKNGIGGTKRAIIQQWQGPTRVLKTQEEEEAEQDGERLLVDDEGSLETSDGSGGQDRMTLRETAWLSLEFCMLWFFANYFASACLGYTSVGSVTILTSTSSVWTLVFCALFKVEGFTVRKLIGVLASLAGIVLISSVDLSGASDENRGNFPHKSAGEIAIGDSMAFFSAVVYGMYVTVMKRRVGNEDRVNMPLFFGLVGLYNLALLWPLFIIFHVTGVETFELPPTGKIWTIIWANSMSSFFSDMSWAYAMLLTTPLVVTVGLSMTIPLSLIGEMIQYQQYASWIYWVGAGIVLLSFLFINHESHDEGEEATSTPAPANPRNESV
ncbi:vacuolar membrane protein [Zalerion maritima]|uniref:Vacuolar membrane protein n=1 Tax=Zalerion maritima TaxID=339359 RepID=A0AAD5RY26_9PEZI|nr:vacuolar membrane protein [Zalerion maritima]